MSGARSWLYVPGNARERLESAPGRGADALIADLEDSVPVADKRTARETVARWLVDHGGAAGEVWVRINADSLAEDVQALPNDVAVGVVVPKAEPELLANLDDLLADRERQLGLPAGHLRVVALVETAQGVLRAPELARAPRVAHLGLGEADLAADLRVRLADDRRELEPVRMQVVLASAAAGIAAPIGPTATDFRDLQALRRTTQALLHLGFRARTAIHPAQIGVINDVFTPTEREVAEARQVIEAFERAGSGVTTDAGGRMVDVAVVRSAREVLARAARTTAT